MATEEEIKAEPRLSDEQEVILYNITLRQDELGRVQTNVLLSKIENDPVYKELIDRTRSPGRTANSSRSGYSSAAFLSSSV